jgi:L-ascorbate metabolism protein UlaG (beta-lactamase superfamily)
MPLEQKSLGCETNSPGGFATSMTTVLLACGIFFACLYGGSFVFSGPFYSGPVSEHFDGARFYNQNRSAQHDFKAFLTWITNRNRGPWQEHGTDNGPGPRPPARVANGQLLVTPVGHSTFLIQADGVNILTDPIWSERASPVSFTGPRRVQAPGLRLEDLPSIDLILISHNHYDHLDRPTLRNLARSDRSRVVTTLGNTDLIKKAGFDNVCELDWWQHITLPGGMRITCVPAQHFSGRSMRDSYKTLWGGFVIEGAAGPVYFAGDTGYGMHFEEIARRVGPLRLAFLPIGAYKPEWFMWPGHMGPDDALKAHFELKARTSIAMHFGTFPLGDDGQHEAAEALEAGIKKASMQGSRFLVPDWGRAIEVQ